MNYTRSWVGRPLIYREWNLNGHRRFVGSYAALQGWVRKEDLFYGERNYVKEPAYHIYITYPTIPNQFWSHLTVQQRQRLGSFNNNLWGGWRGFLSGVSFRPCVSTWWMRTGNPMRRSLDQVFWVRRHAAGVWDMPQRPEHMIRVPVTEQSGE